MHRHAARAGWLRERGDYAPGNLDNGGSPLGPCAMERSWSPDEDAGCSGAGISHGVRSMYSDFENPGNSGQLLVAIDINTLMPLDTFYDRMELLIGAIFATVRACCFPAKRDGVRGLRPKRLAASGLTNRASRPKSGRPPDRGRKCDCFRGSASNGYSTGLDASRMKPKSNVARCPS